MSETGNGGGSGEPDAGRKQELHHRFVGEEIDDVFDVLSRDL